MTEVLGKLLWRSYVFILLASIALLFFSSKYLWNSIVKEVKTELIYSNKIVSSSLFSMLSKDEALFRITGERLLELGLHDNNPESIKLLDDVLSNNKELVGIGIASPTGEVLITSSNLNKKNLPNLLQKEETKVSFKKALNSDSIVMGRTYFLKEVNDWIVPLRYRILNKNKQLVAVFTTGIKVKGNNSPWQNTSVEDSLRVSVIDSNYYFQFASFVNNDELEKFYKQAVSREYLDFFSKTLYQQTGFTLDDFMTGNHGIAFLDYIGPTEDELLATFNYDVKFGHFIFTTLKKSQLNSKFMGPFSWLSSLLIGFNLILFWLFRHLSKLQKKSKRDLQEQSQHDQLTGLPNIRYLSSCFNKIREYKNKPYTVIFIDLDNFKNSNDIYGHTVGDKILIEVAQRLKKYFDKGLCLRQGGDEFIVITASVFEPSETLEICNDFLLSLKKPIIVDELEFSIRASIGITHSPTDGHKIETLLRKADIAMYEAKRRKCGVYVFTQELEKFNSRKAMIGKELNHAMEKGEFSLVYQPQFDVTTQKIIGIEALLRWDNDILHKVSPSEFIPIAESTGAIIDIGKFVFEKALVEFQQVCTEILDNNKRFNQNNRFRLSINVSILQLSNENFLEHLFALTKKYNCEKAKLILEITETLIIANHDKVRAILEELRKSDIEISLDDFGTGYSSLSYLNNLPINELKIDKSFIKDITTSKSSLTMIKSIIDLSKNLGFTVLAEGVETEEQFKLIKKLKCNNIQGFYFSKPLDKEKLLEFLKK